MTSDKAHTCTTSDLGPQQAVYNCEACEEEDRVQAEAAVAQKAKEDEENLKSAKLWHNLALLYGYDAIKRKRTTSFGERVFCELALQEVKKDLLELGVKIEESPTGHTLTVPHHLPFIVFEAEDMESMRALLAEYDAKKASASPPEKA